MRTVDKYLTRIENFLAGGTLIAAAALAVFAVILRNITGDVLFWSEEATIYLIIFSTFFGAVVTLRHNEHVAVDIMPTLLKGKAKKFFVVVAGLATLVYAGFIAYLSWALIGAPFSRTTITPALKLPLWVVELSLAVGMTLFFIRAVEMTVRALRASAADLGTDVLAEEAAAVGIDVEDITVGHDADDEHGRTGGASEDDQPDEDGPDEKGGAR